MSEVLNSSGQGILNEAVVGLAIHKLLVANRGEIACRIISTAQKMGIFCVAVYSDADRNAKHVRMADHAEWIGASEPTQSYLNISAIIQACTNSGVQAVHPGYGFLSENADFAQACTEAGIKFVGPNAHSIRTLGNKATAKEAAQRLGIPVARGYNGSVQDTELLHREADKIGFPLMVKAAAGGGGRGMRLVHIASELDTAIASAQREALASFGSEQVFLERAVLHARHIEIQVLADQHDNVISLGERDCSTQRKNQKIIEEAPAVGLSQKTRQAMSIAAIQLAKMIGYEGAGTVEFLVEDATSENARFYFLEVNTRLQVEHPVTEALLKIDLVEQQLLIAQGFPLAFTQSEIDERFSQGGCALEVRLCTENPAEDFAPQVGAYQLFQAPAQQNFGFHPSNEASLRIDSGLESVGEVSPWYDSMGSKFIVNAPTREQAIQLLDQSLSRTRFVGLQTNSAYLRALLTHSRFVSGKIHTRWIDEIDTSNPRKNSFQAEFTAKHERHSAQYLGAMIVQAAALFAAREGKKHKLLEGFGNLKISLNVACDGIISSVLLRCVAPQTYIGSVIADVALESTKAQTVNCLALNAVWLGDDVWLTSGNLSRLFKQLPFNSLRAKSSTRSSDEVRSTMHGKVSQVLAQIGDEVVIGQHIVSIESMKMEHQLLAQHPGKVVHLAAQIGQQIAPGDLLVKIQ